MVRFLNPFLLNSVDILHAPLGHSAAGVAATSFHRWR
jgi:hypothetical protein